MASEPSKYDSLSNEFNAARAEPSIQSSVNELSPMITLMDIATMSISLSSKKFQSVSFKDLENLRIELREMLSNSDKREIFSVLQNKVSSRDDLDEVTLTQTNRSLLEILVAMRSGIQAFLHPDISISESNLVDIFLQRRCRNVACQSKLPSDSCSCKVCANKSGFCALCMCVVCSKFDFDSNTCRWIGCDFCLHWCHTDCAIHMGQITAGLVQTGFAESKEMQFKCIACGHASELFGFVKDVFSLCALNWEPDVLTKELDCVRRLFRSSEDQKGKELYWTASHLIQELEKGKDHKTVCLDMQKFFAGSEGPSKHVTGLDKPVPEPPVPLRVVLEQEMNRNSKISVAVQKAIKQLDADAEEKANDLMKAKKALDAYEKEMDNKRKEANDIQLERAKKIQAVEELNSIVKLRQRDAEDFQKKADDSRREAEGLLKIIGAETEKIVEEYSEKSSRLRLEETEAKRLVLKDAVFAIEKAKGQLENAKKEMLGTIQLLLSKSDVKF